MATRALHYSVVLPLVWATACSADRPDEAGQNGDAVGGADTSMQDTATDLGEDGGAQARDADTETELHEDASEVDTNADAGIDSDTSDSSGPLPVYSPGITDIEFDSGIARRARIYVPESMGAESPRALVVVLHGGGGQGLSVSEPGVHPLAVFRDVAERERVVIVYPEGVAARDGRLGWNDCRSDNRQASDADDVAFLRMVLDEMQGDFDVPASAVFMAGTSNGGQMTLAFAMHAAERLGAIAVASANLPETPLPGRCTEGPSQPVPILMTHGTADPAMPFEGGCVANLGGGCGRGRVTGAESTRDTWLTWNEFEGTVLGPERRDGNGTDSGPADGYVYDGTAPVVWWRLEGGGHPTPSQIVLTETTAAAGPQNRDIEFAEEAWAFFEQQLER